MAVALGGVVIDGVALPLAGTMVKMAGWVMTVVELIEAESVYAPPAEACTLDRLSDN